MGAQRNFTETQQLDHAPTKMEVDPKMMRRRALMWDNSGGDLDPAEDVRSCCKDSSVLTCRSKRTKGWTVAAKSGQFTTGEMEFL